MKANTFPKIGLLFLIALGLIAYFASPQAKNNAASLSQNLPDIDFAVADNPPPPGLDQNSERKLITGVVTLGIMVNNLPNQCRNDPDNFRSFQKLVERFLKGRFWGINVIDDNPEETKRIFKICKMAEVQNAMVRLFAEIDFAKMNIDKGINWIMSMIFR